MLFIQIERMAQQFETDLDYVLQIKFFVKFPPFVTTLNINTIKQSVLMYALTQHLQMVRSVLMSVHLTQLMPNKLRLLNRR